MNKETNHLLKPGDEVTCIKPESWGKFTVGKDYKFIAFDEADIIDDHDYRHVWLIDDTGAKKVAPVDSFVISDKTMLKYKLKAII